MRFDQRRTTALLLMVLAATVFLVYSMKEYRANRKAEELTRRGIAAFEKNQLDEAEKLFSAAISAEPSFASGWLNLGLIYEKRGKLLEATEALEKAITLTHNVDAIKVARYRLGVIYGDVEMTDSIRGKDWYDRAIWHFERLIEEEPDNAELYLRLGFSAMKGAKAGKGLVALKRASELATGPEDKWIHNKLLQFYLTANMKDDAKREQEILKTFTEGGSADSAVIQ